MRYIHSIAVLTVGDNIKPVQEYLSLGYYLYKIIYKADREDCSVVIVNIDRESVMTIGRIFAPTHIIYGSSIDDISSLIREYDLEEWIESIDALLSGKFGDVRRDRLLRESINAAPFRRYMCRGLLYGGFKY